MSSDANRTFAMTPPSPNPTRRRLLAALPAAALGALTLRPASAALPELVLHGPPAGPSIVAAHAVHAGLLRAVAERTSFRVWRTPDEIRAGFASGKTTAAIVPTYVAANLHNRGAGVRLVNTMTDGLLYVCAIDPGLDKLAKLAGRRIAIPYRNDMPDHVFGIVARAAGLQPERAMTIEYAGSPPEAMQLLLAGRVDAALLSEPSATAAVLQGTRAGKPVARTIDLQKLWAAQAGGPAAIPQAGLAVSGALAQDPATLAALNAALGAAAAAVRADPAAAAQSAAAVLDLPPPVIERSVPHSNLEVRAARAARPALERLFKALAERDPAIVGGRLPDDAFFAA
jgi:NitT/TauT family transport system substrate-binding protein